MKFKIFLSESHPDSIAKDVTARGICNKHPFSAYFDAVEGCCSVAFDGYSQVPNIRKHREAVKRFMRTYFN